MAGRFPQCAAAPPGAGTPATEAAGRGRERCGGSLRESSNRAGGARGTARAGAGGTRTRLHPPAAPGAGCAAGLRARVRCGRRWRERADLCFATGTVRSAQRLSVASQRRRYTRAGRTDPSGLRRLLAGARRIRRSRCRSGISGGLRATARVRSRYRHRSARRGARAPGRPGGGHRYQSARGALRPRQPRPSRSGRPGAGRGGRAVGGPARRGGGVEPPPGGRPPRPGPRWGAPKTRLSSGAPTSTR